MGGSYSDSRTFLLPPALTGRFHLLVVTDAGGAVFENSLTANNVAESPDVFDVMTIPYADLVFTSLQVPPTGSSGQPFTLSWTVENRGIGLTSTGSWSDSVWLATDPAGNRERPPFGFAGPDDGSSVNLGALPTADATTPPNFGIAPELTPEPSTNPLFAEAEQGIPAAEPLSNVPEFDLALRPFAARSFATGIQQSHANIGPMAVAEAPDGSIVVSGGPSRGTLWRFSSEGGITTAQGESIVFVYDAQGRLASATGPDGRRVVYGYDDAGNLVSVRHLQTSRTVRYGYDRGQTHLLTLVAASDAPGEVITYDQTVRTAPVQADLGGSSAFQGQAVAGVLAAGDTHRYSFAVRGSELASTATGTVLVRATVTASTGGPLQPAAPLIDALAPLTTHTDADRATAVFEIDHEGLYVLAVAGANALTAGDYELDLSIAGDVNADGQVNGLDSERLAAAQGSQRGDAEYDAAADLDGDGDVDPNDTLLLTWNYGFVMNRPPEVNAALPDVMTHEDLPGWFALSSIATDPDGDPLSYRLVGATHGMAALSPTGDGVIFTPETGYTGPASLQVVADDGFNVSEVATIQVTVSDAPLIGLDILNRLPHLAVGQQAPLLVVGDFADQEDVPLGGSYLAYTSSDASVASVSAEGMISSVADGSAAVTVRRGELRAATAVVVGQPQDLLSAYLDALGLDVYPQTLALAAAGQTRQLWARIAGDAELDVTAAADTLYVTADPAVATVSTDGLITVAGFGETTVTVIHGPTEVLVPVHVAALQTGPVVVGPEGGVIASGDGYELAIGPDTLAEQVPVSITSLAAGELPFGLPEPFDYVGGFELDLGEWVADHPVQLAAPAAGLAAGTEVFVFRATQLPDENGGLIDAWMLVDNGWAGADGVIRTSSPPYPGLSKMSAAAGPTDEPVAGASSTATPASPSATMGESEPLAAPGEEPAADDEVADMSSILAAAALQADDTHSSDLQNDVGYASAAFEEIADPPLEITDIQSGVQQPSAGQDACADTAMGSAPIAAEADNDLGTGSLGNSDIVDVDPLTDTLDPFGDGLAAEGEKTA